MTLDAASTPRLAPGVRLRFDAVRQAWGVLAPERLFLPDDEAVEILKLLDGVRTLSVIVDELASRYAAPREIISTDVTAMLRDLAAKGAVRL